MYAGINAHLGQFDKVFAHVPNCVLIFSNEICLSWLSFYVESGNTKFNLKLIRNFQNASFSFTIRCHCSGFVIL